MRALYATSIALLVLVLNPKAQALTAAQRYLMIAPSAAPQNQSHGSVTLNSSGYVIGSGAIVVAGTPPNYTVTVPAGVTRMQIVVAGAGGPGADDCDTCMGGGSPGRRVQVSDFGVTPLAGLSVVVGTPTTGNPAGNTNWWGLQGGGRSTVSISGSVVIAASGGAASCNETLPGGGPDVIPAGGSADDLGGSPALWAESCGSSPGQAGWVTLTW